MGVVAKMLKLSRNGAVGIIDWLGIWARIGFGLRRYQIGSREHNDSERQQNNRGKRCERSQRTINNVLIMRHAEPPDSIVTDDIE